MVLERDEARHARSVLRLDTGDRLCATDGRATIYTCTIETIDARQCVCRIDSRQTAPPPAVPMHFFVGLPRREAFERVLENLVPLGVSSITPMICRHCQGQWWEKKYANSEARFGRIMISAMKQSLSPFLPALNAPTPFDTALANVRGGLVFADEHGERIADTAETVGKAGSVSCFVGPPGGFAPVELETLRGLAHTRGAAGHGLSAIEDAPRASPAFSLALRLSPYRLRTELAAAALASAVAQAIMHEETGKRG